MALLILRGDGNWDIPYSRLLALRDQELTVERDRSRSLTAAILPKAIVGQKFVQGRKPGSGGPIRKAIAKLFAKNPTIKNPEIWEAIKANPPKGWSVEEPKYSR